MKVFNADYKTIRFAEEVRGGSYVWGDTDCASLVLRVYDKAYDPNPLRKYLDLPEWNTEIGAKRALTKIQSIPDTLDIITRTVTPNFERTFDIFLKNLSNDIPTMGVLLREDVLTSNQKQGVFIEGKHEFNPEEIRRVDNG